MNNTLGDALQKAFDAKKNDYTNFVGKGKRLRMEISMFKILRKSQI